MNEIAPKQTKSRSTCATAEAIALIESTVVMRNDELGAGRRLTREIRADLMGVSVITSDRILAGKKVDRATLAHVFVTLDLPWSSQYEQPDSAPTQVATSHLNSPRRPEQRRFVAYGLGISLVLATVFLWFQTQIGLRETSPRWKDQINSRLENANRLYFEARYDEASQQLAPAIKMAKEHEAAGHLASALQLTGDLGAATGNLQASVDAYSEAIRLRMLLNRPQLTFGLHEALATSLIRLGRFHEAEQHLDTALQGFQSEKETAGQAMVYRDYGTSRLLQGDIVNCRKYLQMSLDAAGHVLDPGLKADIRSCYADLLLREGKYDEAKRSLVQCLDYWKNQNHPRWIALTKLKLARVEFANQAPEAAKQLALESNKLFVRAGDRARAIESEQLLQQL